MSQALKGKSEKDAFTLINYFLDLMKKQNNDEHLKIDNVEYNALNAFKSIVNFPMRINCATLSWITAEATIRNKNKQINIEDYK